MTVIHAPRPRLLSTVRRLLWVAALLVTGIWWVVPTGRWIDRNLLDGRAKDVWNFVRWQEDWASAVALPSGLDRSWLQIEGRKPLRIGHALGASGQSGQNRLESVQAAWDDGIRLFEVDIWLDSENELRCHHGPPAPAPKRPGDCTLAKLLPLIAGRGGWIILDIKTDFEKTGARITDTLIGTGFSRRVIFQLYQPAHTLLFTQWAQRIPLAEPIVTAYASHRRVQHLADHASALHVMALTIPIETLTSMKRLREDTALLVHPVHDCRDWQFAERRSPYAVYTVTHVHCD